MPKDIYTDISSISAIGISGSSASRRSHEWGNSDDEFSIRIDNSVQGTLKMNYLCGCSVESKMNYAFTEVPGKPGVFTPMRYENGEQVCPEHGMPLPPPRNHLSPVIQTPNGAKIDLKKAYPRSGELKIEFSADDRRFNDDPEEFGKRVLAERHSVRNGKSDPRG